mmetsp:Transcript_52145/g.156513  ORF Transcript_52145/g.156513 Transcript_52145/m.156513 type:complete len:264 (-) Transcript_52145:1578-2369(-)
MSSSALPLRVLPAFPSSPSPSAWSLTSANPNWPPPNFHSEEKACHSRPSVSAGVVPIDAGRPPASRRRAERHSMVHRDNLRRVGGCGPTPPRSISARRQDRTIPHVSSIASILAPTPVESSAATIASARDHRPFLNALIASVRTSYNGLENSRPNRTRAALLLDVFSGAVSNTRGAAVSEAIRPATHPSCPTPTRRDAFARATRSTQRTTSKGAPSTRDTPFVPKSAWTSSPSPLPRRRSAQVRRATTTQDGGHPNVPRHHEA